MSYYIESRLAITFPKSLYHLNGYQYPNKVDLDLQTRDEDISDDKSQEFSATCLREEYAHLEYVIICSNLI